MAFVVDGSEWQFDAWSAHDIEECLSNLVERMWIARERGERVWVGEDLQTRKVLNELSLWELWSANAPVRLSNELRQELVATLGNIGCYLDESKWPDGFEDTNIQREGEAVANNADIAWAHHHGRAGRAIACLGLRRSGTCTTHSKNHSVDVHWVLDERGHRDFFRHAIAVERDNEATLERLAPHAYPDLLFLKGVWKGLSRFDGGYDRVRKDLQKHLAAYDDHGAWIFAQPPPAETEADTALPTQARPGQQLIERRFASRGVNVAPENPNVANNKKCREARELVLKGRTLYFGWHGKLELHVNRIHIHEPVIESDNKVIVGIFHRHLPLP